MKPVIILLIAIMIISISILPAHSQSSRTQEITVSENIFSINLPVVGALKIDMKYSIDFEIRKPSSIEAGHSDTITIIPKTGTLYTSSYLGDSYLGTIDTPISLGDRKSIPLAGAFGVDVHVVALPTGTIQASTSGPATISPQTKNIQSAGPLDFKIYVKENIGTSNTIKIKFPVTLYVAATGGVGLIIRDLELEPVFIPFTTKTLTESVSIYKNYSTYLSLQVSEGSKTGYIKVLPKLTYENGNNLSEYVSIYVDGAHKTNIKANQWSGNLNVGSGSHNVQAKFSEQRSSDNSSITFLSSQSNVQQITVKSQSSSSTQSSHNTQSSSKNGLSCGSGTYEKNGECVAAGFFDGIIWFFEDLFKQFSFSGSKDSGPDLDNDGIVDTKDMCNTKPETYNGYRDSDGCPD